MGREKGQKQQRSRIAYEGTDLRQIVRRPSALRGAIPIQGDKSISHRALLLNSIANGKAKVTSLSSGEDVRSTRRCLEALGGSYRPPHDGLDVHRSTWRRARQHAGSRRPLRFRRECEEDDRFCARAAFPAVGGMRCRSCESFHKTSFQKSLSWFVQQLRLSDIGSGLLPSENTIVLSGGLVAGALWYFPSAFYGVDTFFAAPRETSMFDEHLRYVASS